MTREQATEVLIAFNDWRRYDGPIDETPAMPDPKDIGQAIDIAIAVLQAKEEKIPRAAEDFKNFLLADEKDVPTEHGYSWPKNMRAVNICRYLGIETVYDLAGWPQREIMKQRNLGKKSFWWLNDVLRKYGLTWGMWESGSYLKHKKAIEPHIH